MDDSNFHSLLHQSKQQEFRKQASSIITFFSHFIILRRHTTSFWSYRLCGPNIFLNYKYCDKDCNVYKLKPHMRHNFVLGGGTHILCWHWFWFWTLFRVMCVFLHCLIGFTERAFIMFHLMSMIRLRFQFSLYGVTRIDAIKRVPNMTLLNSGLHVEIGTLRQLAFRSYCSCRPFGISWLGLCVSTIGRCLLLLVSATVSDNVLGLLECSSLTVANGSSLLPLRSIWSVILQ